MTPSSTSARSDPWRLDVLAVAALLGLAVILPVVLGAASGAILVPHNDDPSMRRVALGLWQDGRLALNGWTSMTLVGQIAFVQPLLWIAAGGPLAFAASTILFTAAGVVASYHLVRRILAPMRATVAVLGVLVFPGFLLNTTSFMTDVPAWATSMICLSFGAVALERSRSTRWRWLVVALIVGCFAFSIRQFAIAAPLAVLIATGASETGSRRRYWLAGGVVIAVCAAIYLFSLSLPGQHEPPPELTSAATIRGLQRAGATLALILSPALVLAGTTWWRRWRLPDVIVGAGLGLVVYREPVVAVVRSRDWSRMLVGNLLEPTGNLGVGTLAGGRPELFGPSTWTAMNAFALIAVLCVAAVAGGAIGALVRGARTTFRDGDGLRILVGRLGSTRAMIGLFAAGYGSLILAWGLAVITFDRYLWPLVIPMYALLLSRPDGVGRRQETDVGSASSRVEQGSTTRVGGSVVTVGLASILLLGLGATSLVLLANADAFDAARWRMGDVAVSKGLAAGTVDAGLEWVIFHATGTATPYATAPAGSSRYDAWWPSFRLCAMASTSPLSGPGLELIERDEAAYRLLLFAGPAEPLYLYRVRGPDCP